MSEQILRALIAEIHDLRARLAALEGSEYIANAGLLDGLHADATGAADAHVVATDAAGIIHAQGIALTEGYVYRATVHYTSSGTFTKGSYPWLRAIRVRVQGGGGGGGGATTTGAGATSQGAGGAGGAYAEAWLDEDAIAALAASETVTVGAGGAGQSGDVGLGGGTSSFATVSAPGSQGGAIAAATSGNARSQDVSPSMTGSGDMVIPGGPGDGYWIYGGAHYRYPRGGSSILGSGGRGGANDDGGAGAGYGAGGGGATNLASQGTARSGGNGAPGIVILELYA